MQNEAQERAAFEKVWLTIFGELEPPPPPIKDWMAVEAVKRHAWTIWQARASLSVPEAWKLVPVEPTQMMVEEGADTAIGSHYCGSYGARAVYSAMLSAAPAAPAPKTVWTPPKTAEEAIERMREDGDADPEGTARMNYPGLFVSPDAIAAAAPSAPMQEPPASLSVPEGLPHEKIMEAVSLAMHPPAALTQDEAEDWCGPLLHFLDIYLDIYTALRGAPEAPPVQEPPTPAVSVKALDVDALAQEIRRVDGNHSLGAGALAEALMPFLSRNRAEPSTSLHKAQESPAGWVRVKALEWTKPNPSLTMRVAETPFGTYRTWTHSEAYGFWFWSLGDRDQGAGGDGASEAGVEAAARADYERRALSVLDLPEPAQGREEPEAVRALPLSGEKGR